MRLLEETTYFRITEGSLEALPYAQPFTSLTSTGLTLNTPYGKVSLDGGKHTGGVGVFGEEEGETETESDCDASFAVNVSLASGHVHRKGMMNVG